MHVQIQDQPRIYATDLETPGMHDSVAKVEVKVSPVGNDEKMPDGPRGMFKKVKIVWAEQWTVGGPEMKNGNFIQ